MERQRFFALLKFGRHIKREIKTRASRYVLLSVFWGGYTLGWRENNEKD